MKKKLLIRALELTVYFALFLTCFVQSVRVSRPTGFIYLNF